MDERALNTALKESDLRPVASLVEVLQEAAFVFVFDLLVVRVSLVSLYSAATDGCDLVEDEAAPDVLLLNVVESLVALGHEVVDGHDVARLAVLSPVACQLQLGHFGVGVPPVPVHSDDEGHVSAPLPEETQTLEVRLDDGA